MYKNNVHSNGKGKCDVLEVSALDSGLRDQEIRNHTDDWSRNMNFP